MNNKLFVLILAFALALAACGGEEETGVTLQQAGGNVQPTTSPTPPPENATASTGIKGRLLLLQGQQFAFLDLATGETTPFIGEGLNASTPAFFTANPTRGSFFSLSQFGVVDLETGEVSGIRNTGSFPTGMSISPDGEWLWTTTGGSFINRLAVNKTDDTFEHRLASSSTQFYQARWTVDSRLLWWAIPTERGPDAAPFEPEFLVFDPRTVESEPLGDQVLDLIPEGFVADPNGQYAVRIPVAAGSANAGDNPNACFDSFIERIPLPVTSADPAPTGETFWTESRLVASSPQWLDPDQLLFARFGYGDCGDVEGEAQRQVVLLDMSASPPTSREIAGPLGNADDLNDRTQTFGRAVGHLYSPSPDGRYLAWISGGVEARESNLMITNITTGETQQVLNVTPDAFFSAADWIEDGIMRQVIWLN